MGRLPQERDTSQGNTHAVVPYCWWFRIPAKQLNEITYHFYGSQLVCVHDMNSINNLIMNVSQNEGTPNSFSKENVDFTTPKNLKWIPKMMAKWVGGWVDLWCLGWSTDPGLCYQVCEGFWKSPWNGIHIIDYIKMGSTTGCLRKLGYKWFISYVYMGVYSGYNNPLILSIDPNSLPSKRHPSSPKISGTSGESSIKWYMIRVFPKIGVPPMDFFSYGKPY